MTRNCIDLGPLFPTIQKRPRGPIQNRKWVGIFAIVLTFVFGGAWPRRSSRREFPG